MQNMMRRSQMGLIFELVKLALMTFSGILTYGFLSRFLADFWFRILALVLYEGGLLFWHYVHHYKTETPAQHLFSKNLERLSLAAVGSAAGYQLLTLVSHGFGDSLPLWTHTAIEITTAVVFMMQLFAFMKWEKLSHYYRAVEHSYNLELSNQQSVQLASIGSVKVVESDAVSGENRVPSADTSEADVEITGNTDMVDLGMGQKLLAVASKKLRPIRVEDRLLTLESLAKSHPELSVKQIAEQTGLSATSVRRWQKEGK